MKQLAVTVLALLFTVGSSFAWTPKVQEEIVKDALQLSPKYLRVVLEKNFDQLMRGANTAEAEAFDGATVNIQETELPRLITREGEAIGKLLKKPKGLPEAAYRFGVIARYAGQVGNPLNVQNDDQAEAYYRDLFDAYVQKELKNFRVAFRGYTEGPFRGQDLEDYFAERAQQASRFYKPLSLQFMKDGKIADINSFSHQSVPFAVASLSYGYAVTTVADVWHGLWKSVGGSASPQQHLSSETQSLQN